jgi:hypothetical protein
MQQYVVIFRQGINTLPPEELAKRAAETREWAQIQNAAGHQLEPRILNAERYLLQADGTRVIEPATEIGSITALLFLQANDLAQAAKIASEHPAVRYGATIEVRAWAPPVQAT